MRAGKIDKQKIFQNSQKQCETVELGLVLDKLTTKHTQWLFRVFAVPISEISNIQAVEAVKNRENLINFPVENFVSEIHVL